MIRAGAAWAVRAVAGARVEVALVLLALAILGPIVAVDSAQPASRYALTAALAERHSVDITGYPLGVDRALYDGHLRSDKAPGQPVFAVPFYLVARALGAENATHKRVAGNLGLWFVALGTSVLPFAILLALLYRAALRVGVSTVTAVAASLALGFGGLLLPYTSHLFGHVLGAALAFGAWFVLEPRVGERRALLGAGALLGAAVFVEYHAAVVALAVLAWAAWRVGRRAGWLVLGAAPFAVALGVYQWRAFGAPWHLPFGYFAGTINGTTEGGYTMPTLHGFALVLVGMHGILQNCPIVLVAVGLAIACLACSASDAIVRRNCILALTVFGVLLFLIAGWSGTPTLETPGPRYLAPAIPFLIVPLAAMWQRAPRLFGALAAVGAAVGMAALFTTIVVSSDLSPARDYLTRVIHRDFVPTVWSMGMGTIGVAVYFATIIAATLLLTSTVRDRADVKHRVLVAVQ